MPSPLSYRPHYHRDWISSSTVRRMSYAARGIYNDLLDTQWEEGHIDTDPEDIKGVLRCSDAEWDEFAPFLDKCFPVADEGRQNPRCAEERAKATSKVEKNRANAKQGGEAKARNHYSDGLANARETLERSPSDGLPIPDTDTDKPPIANAITPSGGAKRFQKPTLEDLTGYMSELGLPAHFPQKFLDHYDANGWKVGRNPMKDWRATVRNWKAKEAEHSSAIVPAARNGRLTNQEVFETAMAAMEGM